MEKEGKERKKKITLVEEAQREKISLEKSLDHMLLLVLVTRRSYIVCTRACRRRAR